MNYPYNFKKECVEASKTMSVKEIYEQKYKPTYNAQSFKSFKRSLQKWKSKQMADDGTLCAGTYEGFTAHNATVQVDGHGNITQAWIKQEADQEFEQILQAIRENYQPVRIKTQEAGIVPLMLEIPLFDMHFGVAKFSDYETQLKELLSIVRSQPWEEINILLGQDLLHTNDMRGHTAKGTDIGEIDFGQAWKDAFRFWDNVIEACLKICKKTKIRYTRGNHDECTSWCLAQALHQRFPDALFDDSIGPRKCISWRSCMIGYGHCEYTTKLDKLFHDFVCDFPEEFSRAKVREIHTGHLHRESCDDSFMVRRLASAVPADRWSRENGYIGANKRFQVFVWKPGRLWTIYYI